MFKFVFDTVLAAILLLVLSPVILVCVIAIRRDSPGPGIFRQTRVGRHEKSFTCYKLRTMAVTTANVPSHEAAAGNITAMGGFLRRSKLDELPQLINVLRGEMSFVGPRPCLPQQAELIRQRRDRGVFVIRPGITGLAQIQGVDMSNPAKLAQIDGEYVRSMSFMGDLRIILATVSGSGQGDRIRSTENPPTNRPSTDDRA